MLAIIATLVLTPAYRRGSSAIDSGDPDLIGFTDPEILDLVDLDGDGDSSESLPPDLAENPRVKPGTAVDRGAYEVQ